MVENLFSESQPVELVALPAVTALDEVDCPANEQCNHGGKIGQIGRHGQIKENPVSFLL